MNATITIKTNQVYFEQFPTPCGEPETSEVQMAWEAAIYKAIEDAGWKAEVKIHVGHDPAVQKYVTIELDDECDCENGNECDCEAKANLAELIQLSERYGQLIAENAVDAGYEAAAARSDEFVKASQELSD